jgi:PEGA domain
MRCAPEWSSRLGACLLLIAALASSGCNHLRGGGRSDVASVLEIGVVDPADLDADVWVDGQYIGQVGAVSGQLKLAPGVHRVEVRKPGHFPVQRTVRVDRKPAASVHVEAELLGDPR